MHSNGPRDKEQDQCDSRLSPEVPNLAPTCSPYLTASNSIVVQL